MRLIRPDHERLNGIVMLYLGDMLRFASGQLEQPPLKPTIYEERLPDEPTPGIWKHKGFTIVVSIERNLWTVGLTHESNRLPKLHELKEIRVACAPPDAYMAMIFPPVEDYINIGQVFLHMHEIRSGE
tara:strand:- start:381 stop:764 length:384 start_codon:yes stop_codon:yes gene_type:complete